MKMRWRICGARNESTKAHSGYFLYDINGDGNGESSSGLIEEDIKESGS